MNIDEINNSITTVSYPSAEQYSYNNHQQGNNSTRNHINSEDDIKVVNEVKESRKTPIPLYISFSFILNHHNEYIVSLGSIHVGQDIELQQLYVHLLCLRVYQSLLVY
jgi:hypothetical protein